MTETDSIRKTSVSGVQIRPPKDEHKDETYCHLMKSRVIEINSSSKCRKILLQILLHLLSGLAALSFKRLVISGHSSPMFGKYFEAK